MHTEPRATRFGAINVVRRGPVNGAFMPLNRMIARKTTIALVSILLLEAMLVLSLQSLGWHGTGNALQLASCIIVTLLPLLVALGILLCNRLRFSLRSMLTATTLVVVFLMLSLMPIVRHRAARQTSMRLLSSNATINEGLDWDEFYSQIELQSPPKPTTPARTAAVPPWLTSFTIRTSSIPPDDAVRSIWLNTDEQCHILADNWERFVSLQHVSITGGVSDDGFRLLQQVLPQFKHLDSVHTNAVEAPSDWYGSLTNIRTLWIWGEGASRGKPFNRKHLNDIVSLSNLETFMVLGYAFNDADARKLATSTSIKRVILRGTAVTFAGETDLSNDAINRIVYRN